MCTMCQKKQDWLLENGDGTLVVCRCSTPAGTTSTHQGTQTPVGLNPPTASTFAPKRVKHDQKFWMSPGRDIRRHLFREHDERSMGQVNGKRWAILKIESIQVSPTHWCIRRFYIGDEDGCNYLELEFYPCTTYAKLDEVYKNQYHGEQRHGHRLTYNPIRRSPPCTVAVSKINEFIVYNDIEVVLYNSEPWNTNNDAEYNVCVELDIPFMNINGSTNTILADRKRDLSIESQYGDVADIVSPKKRCDDSWYTSL